MKLITILSNISIFKTIAFNVRYFGLKSIFRLPAIVAKNVKFQNLKGNIYLDNPTKFAQIRLGFPMVSIFDCPHERTLWNNCGNIYVRGRLTLGSGFRLGNSGDLLLGDTVAITANSTIVCRKKVTISDDCLISWDVLVMDTDFHKIFDSCSNQINNDEEIVINKHCWIGCRSLILKGSVIPDNSIIAAGSIVASQVIQKNCVYSSFGKIIHNDIDWSM